MTCCWHSFVRSQIRVYNGAAPATSVRNTARFHGVLSLATLASLIAESLVDLIVMVPEDEQAKLMAHTVAALGDLFLQKSGADGGGSSSTH